MPVVTVPADFLRDGALARREVTATVMGRVSVTAPLRSVPAEYLDEDDVTRQIVKPYVAYTDSTGIAELGLPTLTGPEDDLEALVWQIKIDGVIWGYIGNVTEDVSLSTSMWVIAPPPLVTMQGETGPPPDVDHAVAVTTLDAGESATATATQDPETGVVAFEFEIPKGDAGSTLLAGLEDTNVDGATDKQPVALDLESGLWVPATGLSLGVNDGDQVPRTQIHTDGKLVLGQGLDFPLTHNPGAVGNGSDTMWLLEQTDDVAHGLTIIPKRMRITSVENPNASTYVTANPAWPLVGGTLTVKNTAGLYGGEAFPASGTVIIEGLRASGTATYTGKTTTSLTGVTSDYTASADQSNFYPLWVSDALGAPILWLGAYGGLFVNDQITFRAAGVFSDSDQDIIIGYDNEGARTGAAIKIGNDGLVKLTRTNDGFGNNGLAFWADGQALRYYSAGLFSSVVRNLGTSTQPWGTGHINLLRADDGTAAATSIGFRTDPGTGLFYGQDGFGFSQLRLAVSGVQQWTMDTNGHLYPIGANNLGSSTNRVARVYATNIALPGTDVLITAGTGTPEGVVSASVGSMYIRTDGTAGTTQRYVKETGTSTNTGWVAQPSVTGAGAVTGPASVSAGRVPTFNGTTGKLIQDSGYGISNLRDRANHTGTQAGTTVDAATTAARGTVELADSAEVAAGTSTTTVVTPADVKTMVTPGAVLVTKIHNPGSTSTFTHSGGALTTVDANLTVTFVTPASGQVVVRLTARFATSASSSPTWGLMESGSQIGGLTILGTAYNTASAYRLATVDIPITGLTPGSSHTVAWAWRQTAATTQTIKAGQTNGDEGAAVMVVTAA